MEKAKWKIKLSDGNTLQENESLSWQKLQQALKMGKLEITEMSLVVGDREFRFPDSNNPVLVNFSKNLDSPVKYSHFRAVAHEPFANKTSEFWTVIEAQYPTYKTQIWVSELDTNICYIRTEAINE